MIFYLAFFFHFRLIFFTYAFVSLVGIYCLLCDLISLFVFVILDLWLICVRYLHKEHNYWWVKIINNKIRKAKILAIPPYQIIFRQNYLTILNRKLFFTCYSTSEMAGEIFSIFFNSFLIHFTQIHENELAGIDK